MIPIFDSIKVCKPKTEVALIVQSLALDGGVTCTDDEELEYRDSVFRIDLWPTYT
jgi:hypothetical protein